MRPVGYLVSPHVAHEAIWVWDPCLNENISGSTFFSNVYWSQTLVWNSWKLSLFHLFELENKTVLLSCQYAILTLHSYVYSIFLYVCVVPLFSVVISTLPCAHPPACTKACFSPSVVLFLYVVVLCCKLSPTFCVANVYIQHTSMCRIRKPSLIFSNFIFY